MWKTHIQHCWLEVPTWQNYYRQHSQLQTIRQILLQCVMQINTTGEWLPPWYTLSKLTLWSWCGRNWPLSWEEFHTSTWGFILLSTGYLPAPFRESKNLAARQRHQNVKHPVFGRLNAAPWAHFCHPDGQRGDLCDHHHERIQPSSKTSSTSTQPFKSVKELWLVVEWGLSSQVKILHYDFKGVYFSVQVHRYHHPLLPFCWN